VVGPIADQLAGEIRASTAGKSVNAEAWMLALGGADNVQRVESGTARVLVTVKDAARVDRSELLRLGARDVASPSPTSVHLLHPDAAGLREALGPA